VYRIPISNLDNLKDRVRTCWESLDQQIINKSIDQWRDRLKAVVRVKFCQVLYPMEASTSDTNTVPPAVDHTDIAVVVQRTVRDIARRKRNVIISGLPEPTCDSEAENRLADETAFHMLCEENLTVKPAMVPRGCRRLGRYDGHRPRRLLVHLTSESSVSSLLTVARELRQSGERYIAENVYINPDLSPAEAQDAYEKRQRRRATAAARRQSQQQSPDNSSTGTFDTCTESSTTVASASDASTTDNVAAGSHITTSTSSTTIPALL